MTERARSVVPGRAWPSSGTHEIDLGPRASPTTSLAALVVDDDADLREVIARWLAEAGHRVMEAADGEQATALLACHHFDVAIVDVRLPKVDGLALFRHVHRDTPATAVILMTGHAVIPDAVAAVRAGAFDYITKPFDGVALLRTVERVGERLALRRELERAREEMISRPVADALVGGTPAMTKLASRIELFAASDAPLVVTGESGTGKELVARTLHNRGPRRAGPFVAINCGAFPETLLEAELFGHERGAFTGATKKRDGRFKTAHGGTLLLDEIGEMPMAAQVRLLRVLQEKAIEPLGSDRSVPVDVRIIAATHRNLRELIADGRFREDLYFRLNVLQIAVPPLRERRADLVPLLAHFLRHFTPQGHVPPGVSPGAWAALVEYDYPGNVREFAHAIERALVLSRGEEIDIEHLPGEVVGRISGDPHGASLRTLAAANDEFEREYLLRIARMAPTRSRAAEILGISRKTLWEKLRRYGVSDFEIDGSSEPSSD